MKETESKLNVMPNALIYALEFILRLILLLSKGEEVKSYVMYKI